MDIKIKSEEKMKTKKFEKKLLLNKKTISNLSNGQLSDVKGGVLTLNTYVTVCSCTIHYDCIYTCAQPKEP